ncbi:MAG: ABC-type amino acid transport substrate-binding protein [Enterobacterales bacterium]|jgi:ABC-type amino acid transport substrate-binding protein
MKNRITYFLLYAAILCFTVPLLSEELTQEKSDVLTLVTIENTLPFSFSLPDGTPSGLYVEFWELWSETNNIPIRFELLPFKDGLPLIKQKNTIHSGIFRNEEREQWADFSLPIHNVQTGFIYNRSINKNTKFSELNDVKVSAHHSSFQELYMRENYPDIELSTYQNFDEGVNQLLDNDVQALFAEIPSVNARLAEKGLSGVFIISDEVIVSNNVFAAMAKGQPELLAKINAGIENIPVNEIIKLEKKWLPTLKPFFSNRPSLASLTLAERRWIQRNSSLTLGISPNTRPLGFVNEQGKYSGIPAEYIEHINNILGINIKPAQYNTWLEAFEAFKVGKVDIMAGIVNTPEREKTINFTTSYFEMPTVIVTRKNSFYANTMSSLNGKKVGIVDGYAVELIKRDYPEINIQLIDSIADGFRRLQAGEIDAMIDAIANINYVFNKGFINDLMVTAFTSYKVELSMAARKGLEPLIPILNKVLASMSEEQHSAIANKWLSVRVQTGTELSTVILWVLPIVSFLILIILIFVRMNRRLKIEIDGRKKSENAEKLLVSQLHQSQKMEALGKLTGGIAHDFNNILGVILGYAELSKRKPLNEKKLTSYLEHISHAGERGVKLTKKLLSFTRKQHIEANLVDINELLRHQQDILQKTLTVRIKITLELDENISPVWLERSDLEDAILNMSINAMYALSDNLANAELILKTENVVIAKDYSEKLGLVSGNYVKLCFIDNGCGMSEEISNQVFDPFFSTKGERGTGLGLSQVFGFVQRSSGSITVKSLLEKGTHFTFYFPEYIVEPEDKSVQFNLKEQKLKGVETILIVDDELALLELATELLQVEGYNILVADSGESALMILEKEPVDLVLTDVLMPEMDGYELTAKIKENYPEMKIKLVSGFADEQHNSFVNDNLQRDLIHKPYSRIELLQGVRTLLDS